METINHSQSTRLIKLESRMYLMYLLYHLGIEPTKEKADAAWNHYMAVLGELMSKAY